MSEKVSEVIAEAVKEFDVKFLYKLNQIALAKLYPELYADQEAWLTTTLNRVASVAREEASPDGMGIKQFGQRAMKLGADSMKEKIMAAVRNIKNTKPYKQGEDPRSTENKAGWNTCLTFVVELITNLK